MSIVKYKNKKTGAVAVYESTSHYDPETKQSRPIRKYLGMEDPETGELIPTSGKRGRKQSGDKKTVSVVKSDAPCDYKLLYETVKREASLKDKKIASLENSNKILYMQMKRMSEMISAALKSAVADLDLHDD